MESRKGVFRGLLSCFCINIDVHPVQHHQADSPENDGSPRGFAWSSGEPAVCLRECRVTWFLQLFIRKFQSNFISWDMFFSWGILWWNFGNHCILAPKSRSHLHANKKTGLNNDIERQVQVDTWNNTHGTVLLEKHIRNHRSWDILGPLETEPNSRNTAICPDVQVPIGSYGTNLFDIATNLPWKSTTLGISGQKLPLSWILCVFFGYLQHFSSVETSAGYAALPRSRKLAVSISWDAQQGLERPKKVESFHRGINRISYESCFWVVSKKPSGGFKSW